MRDLRLNAPEETAAQEDAGGNNTYGAACKQRDRRDRYDAHIFIYEFLLAMRDSLVLGSRKIFNTYDAELLRASWRYTQPSYAATNNQERWAKPAKPRRRVRCTYTCIHIPIEWKDRNIYKHICMQITVYGACGAAPYPK